jgi:hypothetical protein
MRSLGDDEPSRGSLAIILHHDGRGQAIFGSPQTRHGSHHDPVLQFDRSQLHPCKQVIFHRNDPFLRILTDTSYAERCILASLWNAGFVMR